MTDEKLFIRKYHSIKFIGITISPFISEQDIQKLMECYRQHFPPPTFPPKMHMLKDHVAPFIKQRKFPLRGGESIHHDFVSLDEDFNRVKPATDQLKKTLEEHFIITAPSNREVVLVKPTRNLKRKHPNQEYPSSA